MNQAAIPEITPPKEPSFQIQRIYLKGTSLEIPHAPGIFLEQGELKIDFQLAPTVNSLSPSIYEVTLRGTVTATMGEKSVYLLEIDQAGIFDIQNLTPEQLAQALEVNCPAILSNYLRTQVTDTLQRALLPLFILPELNWMQAHLDRAAAQPISEAPTIH